jgi:uroporphyrin-III C-methyltransferase
MHPSRPAHPVLLVGAGPGDPELLTLKAVRAISQADVLLVDDLVDRRVLSHAKPQARIVDVGKRAGCPSTPQHVIEQRMVLEALSGRRVVRLKGGDPLVFGRAGEEIDALRAAGLAVEVVPGIGAASGAAASLGLSLTDRRHAPGMALVTGHPQPGGAEPDWHLLAQSGLTLVIYMGLRRSGAIAEALMLGGLPPGTPVRIVEAATQAVQRERLTTLGGLAESPVRPSGAPGVLIVGEVAAAAASITEGAACLAA